MYTDKIILPNWIDKENFIANILTLEGQDLYTIFGFNDSTSCTKFLAKYILDKPKNMKFSKYLKSVLEVEVEVEVTKSEVEVEVEVEVAKSETQEEYFTRLVTLDASTRAEILESDSKEVREAYRLWRTPPKGLSFKSKTTIPYSTKAKDRQYEVFTSIRDTEDTEEQGQRIDALSREDKNSYFSFIEETN